MFIGLLHYGYNILPYFILLILLQNTDEERFNILTTWSYYPVLIYFEWKV